jgi:hypothetical protein
MIQRHVRQAPPVDLYTVHDSREEKVAAIIDPRLPWVIRHNGKYRTIVHPRYETQAEADCAALGLNHAAGEKVAAE